MVDNSLLLLAVKRAQSIGSAVLKSQAPGGVYTSGLVFNTDRVLNQDVPAFCNYVIDEINSFTDINTVREEMKQQMEDDRDFESYLMDTAQSMTANCIYDNGKGAMAVFIYSMTPHSDYKNVQCEYVSIQTNFKLPDVAITVTKMKRSLTKKRKWTEKKYIQASVTHNDFIFALSLPISVMLDDMTIHNSFMGTELISSSQTVSDAIPSDRPRRTIQNPWNKMYYEVTDPSLLKLIHPRWIISKSSDLERKHRQRTYKFDA